MCNIALCRRKLNTKIIVSKLNDSESNDDASEAIEGSVSSNETDSAAPNGSLVVSGSKEEASHVTEGSVSRNAPETTAANGSTRSANTLSSHSDHTKENQSSCTKTQCPKGGYTSIESESLHLHSEHNKENLCPSGNTRLPEHSITDTAKINLNSAVGHSSKYTFTLSSDDQSFITEFMESGQCGISTNDVESVVRALRSYESRRKGC